ncbi:MAG: BrnT family toxin [Pseudomonadota bacterium]
MFEWDAEKAAINFEKHGVGFEEASTAFEYAPITQRADDRRDYGEKRFISIGFSASRRFLTIVWTERGDNKRIISARPASREERETYAQDHNTDFS